MDEAAKKRAKLEKEFKRKIEKQEKQAIERKKQMDKKRKEEAKEAGWDKDERLEKAAERQRQI